MSRPAARERAGMAEKQGTGEHCLRKDILLGLLTPGAHIGMRHMFEGKIKGSESRRESK